MVDVKIQTLYRESEAQTFPWSPPVVQKCKEIPEVLQLNYLKWDNGLPADKYDVELIVRNRKKRAWEIYLAQTRERLFFKQKIISQIEKDDWVFREKDLDEINKYRMELAKKVFDEQKDDFIIKSTKKIDLLNKKILQRHQENIKKIEHEKEKKIRRINNMTKMRYIDKYNKKTIVDSFMDNTDDIYAFKVRLGYQRKNTSLVLCPDAYTSLKGVKIKRTKFEPPSRAAKTKKHDCLRQKFIQGTDQEFDNYFKNLDDKVVRSDKEDQEELKEDKNRVYSASEKSVKSDKTDILYNVESESYDSEEVEKQRQKQLNKYKQSCLDHYNNQLSSNNWLAMESSLLATLLDVSSKEQQRIDEEKKILSVALIAQAERWKREAREEGIRQKEAIRNSIKQRILDQTYETIYQDIMSGFSNVLKESLLNTAVLQAEDSMRATIFDINRDIQPNIDDSYDQENTIKDFKQHLSEELEFEPNFFKKKTESLSDVEEISSKVEELYQDIISIALNLDKIVTTLNSSQLTDSKINLFNDKIQMLLSTKDVLPTLERLKNQTKELYKEQLLEKEIVQDIEKLDMVCDSVLDIADQLYENLIGEEDINEVMAGIESYYDSIVQDELINYVGKNSTLYLFKLMKISHVLSDERKAKFISGNAFKVLQVAKQFCTRVTDIAGKIHHYIYNDQFNIKEEKTVTSEQSQESIQLGYKTNKDTLCEKLQNKFDEKNKTIKEKIEKIKSLSKIDVCKVREEAAAIIDSIVNIWLALDSLTNQLETDDQETKQQIVNKLKCVIDKLKQQFCDVDLLGMKDFDCIVDYTACSEEIKQEKDAEQIVNQLIIASIKLDDMKQQGSLDTNEDMDFLMEPLRSDINEMIKEPDKYPAIHKLTDSSFDSY